MASKEEPSYMMFARANVRDNLPSTPSVVRSLLERIDKLERETKTLHVQVAADVPPMPPHWQGRYRAP